SSPLAAQAVDFVFMGRRWRGRAVSDDEEVDCLGVVLARHDVDHQRGQYADMDVGQAIGQRLMEGLEALPVDELAQGHLRLELADRAMERQGEAVPEHLPWRQEGGFAACASCPLLAGGASGSSCISPLMNMALLASRAMVSHCARSCERSSATLAK